MKVDQPPKIDKILKDGDIFEFGNTKFKVYHVPGHSRGSLAYYSENDKIIFSGDVLFDGSIGRTDLEGGDLDLLIHSIKEKFFKLPNDVEVLSGHGATTTIGKEVNSNPFLLDNVL
jgi:glyoxylase-like metal-dependent hydrolase (beta-lactamase superfamily II)